MPYQDSYKVSEVQLIYRSAIEPINRPQVKTSQDAYNLLHASWNENTIEFTEQFKVLMLNRSARVLGIYEASSGGTTGTVVDTKLIFIAALKANANSIILAHNHPSGGLTPSSSDISITKKLCAAGKLLDISVIDHLIVTRDSYYSFSDNGILKM